MYRICNGSTLFLCSCVKTDVVLKYDLLLDTAGDPDKADQILIHHYTAATAGTSPLLPFTAQDDAGLSDSHQAAKPLNPTSTGQLLALKPPFPHSISSPLYLACSPFKGFIHVIPTRDNQHLQDCIAWWIKTRGDSWSQSAEGISVVSSDLPAGLWCSLTVTKVKVFFKGTLPS